MNRQDAAQLVQLKNRLAELLIKTHTAGGILLERERQRPLVSSNESFILASGDRLRISVLSTKDAAILQRLRRVLLQFRTGQITSQVCGMKLRQLWPRLEHTPADWNDEFLDSVVTLINGPETTELEPAWIDRSLRSLKSLLGTDLLDSQ